MWRRDSNPRHSAHETDKLPLLHSTMSALGFEPKTCSLKDRCSTPELCTHNVANIFRLELDLSQRQVSCNNPHYQLCYLVILSKRAGLEPAPMVLETIILPLNYLLLSLDFISPATGSPTATLLRLHPSPQYYTKSPLIKIMLKQIIKKNILT